MFKLQVSALELEGLLDELENELELDDKLKIELLLDDELND